MFKTAILAGCVAATAKAIELSAEGDNCRNVKSPSNSRRGGYKTVYVQQAAPKNAYDNGSYRSPVDVKRAVPKNVYGRSSSYYNAPAYGGYS